MIPIAPGRQESLSLPMMRDPSAQSLETEADLPVESADAPLLAIQVLESGK